MFPFSGPALSGSLVEGVGFKTMLIGIAVICFLYCPLLCFLKNPPPKTEQEKQETKVNINSCYNTVTSTVLLNQP